MFLKVSVTLRHVPANPRLVALGTAVEAARGAHGWSVEAAAKHAGMTAVTWRNIELAVARARAGNYAKVEKVLGWPEGHCARLLAGEVSPSDDPRIAYVVEGMAHMSDERRAMIADLVRVVLSQE